MIHTPKESKDFVRALGYTLNTFLGTFGSVQGYIYNEITEVKSIANCNALYLKSIINDVGGFDKNFITGQDAELNYRIIKKGYIFLFTPKAIVWHKFRSTTNKWFKRMFQYGRARIKIIKKHPNSLKLIHFIPFFILLILFISILLSFFKIYFLLIPIFLLLIYTFTVFLYSIKVKEKKLFGFVFLAYIIEHIGYTLGEVYGLVK